MSFTVKENKKINFGKFLFVLTILFLICCPIVSGLTETGSFDTSTYSQIKAGDVGLSYFTPATNTIGKNFTLMTQEISGLNGLDYVSVEFIYGNAQRIVNDGTVSSASAPFTSDYGTGIVGYTILYNYLGAYTGGYLYVLFDNPIQTVQTGAKTITLNYNPTLLHGVYITEYARGTAPSDIKLGSQYLAGISATGFNVALSTSTAANSQNLYNNINRKFKSSYEVTLDEVTNLVTGSVTKTVSGSSFSSKVFVKNYQNTIVASEPSLNSNTFNFISTTAPIKLEVIDAYGAWHNTSFLLQPDIVYDYTFTPTSTYPNQSILIALFSNEAGTQLTNLKYISFDVKADNYNLGNKFMATDSSGNALNYLKNSSGYWGIYSNGYTFNLGTTTPNNFDIAFPASGNWTVYSIFEDLIGNQYLETKYYTVLGNTGQLGLTVYPIDGVDGSLVIGAIVDVYDDQLKVWTNRTISNFEDCRFPVATGFYKYVVYAPVGSAYKDINTGNVEGVFVTTESIYTTVTLFPLTEGEIIGDLTNTTVYIGVREPEQLKPIYGATVSISPSGKIAKTNSVGIATFTLVNGTSYKATASASGHQTTAVTFIPYAPVYSFDIAMGSSSNVPSDFDSVTPVVTTRTTVPVITPIGWSNGSAAVCGVVANNASFVDWLKSQAACNGLNDAVGQSLLIASFIIMLLMAVGYGVAKIVGACIGASVGFILAWAVGVIPFFVFVAIIILLICIVAALLAIKASSGG